MPKKDKTPFYVSLAALTIAVCLPVMTASAKWGESQKEIEVLDRRIDDLFESQQKVMDKLIVWQQKMSEDISKVRTDVSFIKGKMGGE